MRSNRRLEYHAPPFLQPRQHRHRRRRAGFAAVADARRCRPAVSPACRISRPRPSASSISSSTARLRSSICSTTSRTSTSMRGTDLPDSVRKGQRLTGMTAYQAKFPTAPSIFKFAQHGESGAWLSEFLPSHRESRRRHRDHPLAADRCHQSRSRRDVFPDRIPARRPSQHRRVDLLRAGQRESGPAGVRRHGFAGRRQLAGAGRPPVGQRLSPHQISGREVPLRRTTPCSILSNPPGYSTRAARRRFLDDLGKLNELNSTQVIRTRKSPPASRSTRWRTGCKLGARTDGSFEGARFHLRDVRAGFAQARHLRRQLHSGAPAGRARRPLHPALPSRLGPAQQSAQGDPRAMPADRPALRRR